MSRELVYPGHPIHLALEIMALFPSVKAASVPGRQFSVALEDHRIPGAGSAVGTALALLRLVEQGKLSPEQAVETSKEWWTENRKDDHAGNIEKGNAQADELKDEFVSTMTAWLTRPVSEREFLPRFRLSEDYILPHAYKRQLNHDLAGETLLRKTGAILDKYDTVNKLERALIIETLDKRADEMDNDGWYMTALTMRSAAHYLREG
jgi:hypothetical protein